MNFGDEVLAEPKPMDVAAAMKKAREDKGLRRDFFIEELTLQQSRKPTPPPEPKTTRKSRAERRKEAKTKTKTEDPVPKGKGRGKGQKGKKGVLKKGKQMHTTVNGCEICFRFNEEGGCPLGDNCKRKHVCQICLGEHPAWNNH